MPIEITKNEPAIKELPSVLEILEKSPVSLVLRRSIPRYSKIPYTATIAPEDAKTLNSRET